MLTTSDKVHTGIIFTLDGAAILANIILIYAIITRTPPHMRAYSILLLNNTFVDITSAIASMLGVARLIYLRDQSVQLYVLIGTCSLIGKWCCRLCQAVHSYLVCHSALIVLHSFFFRLYLIRDEKVNVSPPTSKATLLISIILYIPSLVMMFLYYISTDYAPATLLESLHLEDYITIWNSNLLDIRFLIPITYLCMLAPSSMIVIFFIRRRLIREIKKMESAAKDHHSSIARALTYQLLLPAGQAIAGCTWLLGVAGIWEDEIAERTIMIVSSFLALGSPLINLTFLPPYRRMFGKTRTAPAAMSVVATTTTEIRRMSRSSLVSIFRLNYHQKAMLTSSDQMHIFVASTLDTSAILANLVLVYAIVTRTPPKMRTYSILLLNNVFVDISSATASFLAISRLIYYPDRMAQVYVYIGPCSMVGMRFCHICQTIHMFFNSQSIVILLHSFCFRLYVLRDTTVRTNITARTTLAIAALLYVPTFTVICIYLTLTEPVPDEVASALHIEGYTAAWLSSIWEVRVAIAHIFVMTVPSCSMTAIFFARRRLLQGIQSADLGAKEHHSSIARALAFQMLLPVGQLVATVIWFANVAKIWPGDMPERLITIVSSSFALGSPLINLTFLPPYRRLFQRVQKISMHAANLH